MHAHEKGRDRGRGRQRILSRLHAQCRVSRQVWSHNHEITTCAEIKSWTLNNWATQMPLENHLKFFFLTFIFYFWDRERQSMNGGGAERERGRHRIRSRLQALSCQHRAQHGAQTHKLRSWPEPKLDAQLTEPPRCPSMFYSFCQKVCRNKEFQWR